MGTDIGGLLTKQAGPLPLGMWVLFGGVGVYFAVRSQKAGAAAQVAANTVVTQVPVPVGAVAGYDNAPLILNPIVRINVPEIDNLTGAIVDNTMALGGNTTATDTNTTALGGSTGAIITNTGAVNGNTGAVNNLIGKMGTITTAPAAGPVVVAQTAQNAPAQAVAARTYTIRSGDTLSGIAARFAGRASRWPELYQANTGTIDSVARSRGKAGGGHWIFPGTVLRIPW